MWYLEEPINMVLEREDKVQMKKGLWWTPWHPETKKGELSNEKLRGVKKN